MTPDEFRKAREFLRLEIRWLAADLDVTVRQVNRWENGVTPIPARAVEALEGFLDEYVAVWRCAGCGKGFSTYRSAKAHRSPVGTAAGGHEVDIVWPGLPWEPEVEA